MRVAGLISFFAAYGSTGGIGEYQHCTEYRDILQDYQELLSTHQTCITTNGEQRAEIRAYQNLITNGLQSQIDGVKREQSDNYINVRADMTQEKLTKGNEIKNLQEGVKQNTQTIDTMKVNQDAIVGQQSSLRTVQSEQINRFSGLVDEIKKISAEQCNEIIDQKLQNIPNENDINELRSKFDEVNNDKHDMIQSYFTAKTTANFDTRGQPLPFSKIIAESNSGFDGSTGTMTAKIGGLYHFSASVMADSPSGNNLDMSLMHNENEIHRALVNSGGYQMSSTTATLAVNPGDKIYIKINAYKAYGYGYSIFTGFKISDL